MRKRRFTSDLSLTTQFAPLRDAQTDARAEEQPSADQPPRVVVLGGGTGAPVSIRCLLSLGAQVDAVVAMADNGGSTGVLRAKADVTAPGDVRKCLVAFAENPEDPLAKAFKCRFPFIDNHALGNLLLSSFEDTTGSFIEAIRLAEELLHARGHVYPSTLTHAELNALTSEGAQIAGQAQACKARCPLDRIWLTASDGVSAVQPYAPALEAIAQADYLVLGPGSLFTSVLATVAVPGIAEAIQESPACRVFVSSLSDAQGETRGFSVCDQVRALERHGLAGAIDVVLADVADPSAYEPYPTGKTRVALSASDEACLLAKGIQVVKRDFYNAQYPGWHDVAVLRSAFAEVL